MHFHQPNYAPGSAFKIGALSSLFTNSAVKREERHFMSQRATCGFHFERFGWTRKKELDIARLIALQCHR